MNATQRREIIVEAILSGSTPVSASALAKKCNVSRQVVVGDIALLRAAGHEILATARGYMVAEGKDNNQYIGKIPCCHNAENTPNELYIIVDLGATVVNVIVEHDLYGEITGPLYIKNRADADAFYNRVKASEVKLLSELKSGIHIHTLACRDKIHFEQVYHALDAAGFVVTNND